MTFHLQERLRETSMLPWLDVFLYGHPGCGKTKFILSSYYESESGAERGGPIVFDFDKRGVDATAADLGLSGKIPVIELKSEEEMIYSCTYPKEIIEMVNADPRWKEYKVEVFGYDTVSSMEELILGEPARPTGTVLPATKGSGLLAIQRRRDGAFEPAMGDYKALVNRTKAFLRRVREMPYHSIITCHAKKDVTEESPRGMNVPEDQKVFGIYPNLTGDNKYNCSKLHDFFLYMEEKYGKFTIHTQSSGQFKARTRLKSKLAARLDNVDFWYLKKVYDDARGA
jgi:hypothetical protein